jgi:hypothetical protein
VSNDGSTLSVSIGWEYDAMDSFGFLLQLQLTHLHKIFGGQFRILPAELSADQDTASVWIWEGVV